MKPDKYLLLLLLVFTLYTSLSLQAQVTNKAKLAEFEDAITKGEAFLQAKDYAKAKAEYQKALAIDPQAKYPKDKLAQIRKVYIDPKDETDFQNAVAKGDQFMSAGNFVAAKEQYSAAILIKPDDKQVKEKIASADKAVAAKYSTLKEYSAIINEADKLYSEKNYPAALEKYQQAAPLNTAESHAGDRIIEIESILAKQKAIDDSYNAAVSLADESYMNRDFVTAKAKYEEAARIKPAETYPKSMLDRVKESIVKQGEERVQNEKQLAERYDAALASGDQLVKEDRLNEALMSYREASEIKPQESYPKQKIDEINKTLDQREQERLAEIAALNLKEQQRQDSIQAAKDAAKLALLKEEQDRQAKLDAEKLAEQQRLDAEKLAEQQRLDAEKLAQQQKEEQDHLALLEAERQAEIRRQDSINTVELERIAELRKEDEAKAREAEERLAEQQRENDRLAQLDAEKLAVERRQDSLNLMADASRKEQERLAELKRIEDENIRIAEMAKASEEDKAYYEAVEAGNSYFALQDLPSAIKMYEKAAELKPFENYPKDRILYLSNIMKERLKNNLESYHKFIAAGDLAFQTNVFDKALEEFEKAQEARPDEQYPARMIERIRKLMEDNALITISTDATVLADAQAKKYSFKPVEMRLRKNNYLLIKAKKTSEKAPKVFINYGKDDSKSGGFVLKGIESEETVDYLLRISVQDKWYRVDNNWITLYPEGGDLEITGIQISQGDIQVLK